MSFISYAQNFEDVMLWRALKHIESGVYVDVGANDPEVDSVTKAFYERGWRGLNIEPAGEWYERLTAYRPHDINLKVFAGKKIETIDFYEIPKTGLSTFDASFAKRHQEDSGYEIIKSRVQVETLTSLIKRHSLNTIHFLKIDVEGAEKNVLQGLDFREIRPWIVVIEANLPNSTEETYTDWEDILFLGNYEIAYSDGLNRFYVAQERNELIEKFRYPPNFFDNFVLSKTVQSELQRQKAFERATKAETALSESHADLLRMGDRLDNALARAKQFDERAAKAETALSELEAEHRRTKNEAERLYAEAQFMKGELEAATDKINELNFELRLVYKSKSWRITHLLRIANKFLKNFALFPNWLSILFVKLARWFVFGSIAWLTFKSGSRPRRFARSVLLKLRNWVFARPRLKAKILSILDHYPRVKIWLKRLHHAHPIQLTPLMDLPNKDIDADSTKFGEHSVSMDGLSERACRIYVDLKSAVDKRRQEYH